MPVQFDLPSPTTVDILGSLMKGVKAKYAQPMAQSNLDKLKSLIQGSNLSNQTKQLKMPFVAPNQQSLLDKLKSEIAKTQTETQYIPTKYNQAAQRLGIQGGNLSLNQRRFSPENLDILNKLRQSQIASAPGRGLSALGKNVLEQQRLEQGQNIAGISPNTQQMPNQMQSNQTNQQQIQPKSQAQGQMQNISPESQKLINQYKLQRVKQTTDSSLRKAFPQIASIDKTMASIPFGTVSKFFGPAGQAQAAAEYLQSGATGKLSPEYKAYQNFMTVQGPSLVGQMRQFLQDSVTPGAQEHLRNIVMPKKWTSNPALALNQFQALKNLYDIEKSTRIEAANNPDIYTGKTSESGVPNKQSFPEFNSKQEFLKWKSTASPEQVKAYQEHLHG